MVFGSIARPASPPPASGLAPDDGGHAIRFLLRDLPTRSVRLSPTRAHVVRALDDIHLEHGTNYITIVGLSPTIDDQSVKLDATGPATITDISVHLLPNRDIFEDIYPDTGDSDDSDTLSDSSDSASEAGQDAPGSSQQGAKFLEESETVVALRQQLASLCDEQHRAEELVASAEVRLKFLHAYGRRITDPVPIVSRDVEQPPPRPEIDIVASLETYRAEREKAFCDNMQGKTQGRQIQDKIRKLTSQIERELKVAGKARSEALKLKSKAAIVREKERQRKERKFVERTKEKLRIRQEREACWPRNVYVVKVTLETVTLTPGSTRRNSVSSDTVHLSTSVQTDADEKVVGGLTLSYMTTSAYWSPTYDLSLSTVSNSATLCFDAMLTNHTSETWSNCKVSLTTSQAESTDLTDKLPHLLSWQIKIADRDGADPSEEHPLDNILYSKEEQAQKSSRFFQCHAPNPFGTRSTTHGLPGSSNTVASSGGFGSNGGGLFGQSTTPSGGGLFGSPQASVTTAPVASPRNNESPNAHMVSAPGSNVPTPGSRNEGSAHVSALGAKAGGFGSTEAAAVGGDKATEGNANDPGNTDTNDLNATSASQLLPDTTAFGNVGPISFDEDESSFVQMGLTSNYDLPGARTLKPTAPTKNGVGGSSRQRVARITNFTDINFSRTVVAKYKAAAYLRVKLCNSSKIPILSGPASLTLDGSFLGRTQLPPPSGSKLFGQSGSAAGRCVKPGEYMHLDLGMDPTIEVSYLGPLVKLNTAGSGAAGFLLGSSKETTRVYTRHITLFSRREHGSESSSSDGRNTKNAAKTSVSGSRESTPPSAAAKPVTITVLDQVPTTEDERLRIEVLKPVGLTSGGTKVAIKSSGMWPPSSPSHRSGSGDDDDDTSWGKAEARMLPSGKVEWDVTLNPSRMVKLTLEYQCSHPKGESVTNVS
ncbi:hypothetical protein Micbo1qcDRAFT_235504 [Microdochium bolleyi]|uniref:DUF4139 domain-containing protein n=1 Tax=Microdochium bolleyi TaxID=196109 RepID=A0A136IWM9_9PEZI|nr:hypothetical protein Micbo1qcDRAFT_235504 [Microdochium bolleyi]